MSTEQCSVSIEDCGTYADERERLCAVPGAMLHRPLGVVVPQDGHPASYPLLPGSRARCLCAAAAALVLEVDPLLQVEVERPLPVLQRLTDRLRRPGVVALRQALTPRHHRVVAQRKQPRVLRQSQQVDDDRRPPALVLLLLVLRLLGVPGAVAVFVEAVGLDEAA